jgi:hypothetical protein
MANGQDSADEIVVVTAASPSFPRWLAYLAAFEVVLATLRLASDRSVFPWTMLAAWLVGLLLIVGARGVEARRPTELTLTPEGMTLRQAIGRTRHYAWEEISRLQVDPPGGPRILSVHLKSGGFRRLIRLQDDDVPQVLARWTAVERRRQATKR